MLSRIASSVGRIDCAQSLRLYLNNSKNIIVAGSSNSNSCGASSYLNVANSNTIFASRLIQVRHSGGGKRRPSKSPRLNWKEKVQLGLDKPQIAYKPKPFGYVDEDLQHLRKESDFTVKLSGSKSLKEPELNIDLNIRKVLAPSVMFGSIKTSGILEAKPAKKSFSHSRVFGSVSKKNSSATASN